MNKIINFTKMHSLKNDFIIIDLSQNYNLQLSRQQIISLADRKTGIGCDQLLILYVQSKEKFHFKIYNANGSEAKQCINGLRCIAKYIASNYHVAIPFSITNAAGEYLVTNVKNNEVTLSIPVLSRKITKKNIESECKTYNVDLVNFGNQHAIVKVTTLNSAKLKKITEKIKSSPSFSDNINVSIYKIYNDYSLESRTLENGSGETQACGSSACAIALAHSQTTNINKKSNLEIIQPGGSQLISFIEDNYLLVFGKTTNVFKGTINLNYSLESLLPS
ncbi:MAG: diaminopimelate epimerase [Pseudomonadota bacterium]|nr:diaminopimelate epimerase [Pseudomonadota bacterium]